MNYLTFFLLLLSLTALACGDDEGLDPVDSGSVDVRSADAAPFDSVSVDSSPLDITASDAERSPDAGPSLPVLEGSTLSAANDHSCAVGADGSLYCWGYNQNGALGDGTTEQRDSPVQVLGGGEVVSVTAASHNCLIRGTNVECWGNNSRGQLGDGTTENRLAPVSVPSLVNALGVSTGGIHSCALVAGGSVRCWGGNLAGEIGNGTLVEPMGDPVEVVDLEDAVAVRSSGDWTCALRNDGAVLCWGRNNLGQLGDGTTVQRIRPVRVSGLSSIVDVAVGMAHACALRADGTVWCWGWNEWAQLGIGDSDGPRTEPVQVIGLENAVDVACGDRHSCAVDAGGEVRCWGSNFVGELGDGGELTTEVVVTAELTGVSEIAAGSRHTCARSDSGVYCWGINGQGQSGATATNTRTPNRIELP